MFLYISFCHWWYRFVYDPGAKTVTTLVGLMSLENLKSLGTWAWWTEMVREMIPFLFFFLSQKSLAQRCEDINESTCFLCCTNSI